MGYDVCRLFFARRVRMGAEQSGHGPFGHQAMTFLGNYPEAAEI